MNSVRGVMLLLLISLLVVVSGCTTNMIDKENITAPRSVKLESIPDNAEIIFWSTRNVPSAHIMGPSTLFVMDSTGGNVKAITFEPQSYQHAAISPDRKFIVTSRKVPNRGNGVFILNPDHQTEQQLVPYLTEAGNGGVDWSIDGWIYFRGLEGPLRFGGSEIYRIRPDGSGLTRLTNNPNIAMFDVSISEDGSLITHAALSPFKDSKGETCAKSQIWILNSDGSDHKLITGGGDECGSQGPFPLGDYDPEISPDNKFVVFSRSNNEVPMNFPETLNSSHDIWIASTDGSSPARRITEPGPISIIPDWKDSIILYTEYDERGNYTGLVTINTDGTNKMRIEEGQHGNVLHGGRHGKWLSEKTHTSVPKQVKLGSIPNDAEIIFHKDNHIYVTDSKGDNLYQVTFENPRNYEHVAVSFDGKYIIANEQEPNPTNDPGGRSKLWLFDIAGGTETQLVPGFLSAGNGGTDWDPYGYIYFAGKEENPYENPTTPEEFFANAGANDVYKIKYDGTGLQRIIETPDFGESDVGVSPDGGMISYNGLFVQGENVSIWVAMSDGSVPIMVYQGGKSGILSVHDPEIYDNNTKIVFSKVNPDYWNFPEMVNTAHDLWTININGTGLKRLTKPGPINIIPNIIDDLIVLTELNDDGIDYMGLSIIDKSTEDQVTQRLNIFGGSPNWIPE